MPFTTKHKGGADDHAYVLFQLAAGKSPPTVAQDISGVAVQPPKQGVSAKLISYGPTRRRPGGTLTVEITVYVEGTPAMIDNWVDAVLADPSAGPAIVNHQIMTCVSDM